MNLLPTARSIGKFVTLIVAGVGVMAMSFMVSMCAMALSGGGWLALVLFPILTLLMAALLIYTMTRFGWPWRAVAGALLLASCGLLLPHPSCATAPATHADCG